MQAKSQIVEISLYSVNTC